MAYDYNNYSQPKFSYVNKAYADSNYPAAKPEAQGNQGITFDEYNPAIPQDDNKWWNALAQHDFKELLGSYLPGSELDAKVENETTMPAPGQEAPPLDIDTKVFLKLFEEARALIEGETENNNTASYGELQILVDSLSERLNEIEDIETRGRFTEEGKAALDAERATIEEKLTALTVMLDDKNKWAFQFGDYKEPDKLYPAVEPNAVTRPGINGVASRDGEVLDITEEDLTPYTMQPQGNVANKPIESYPEFTDTALAGSGGFEANAPEGEIGGYKHLKGSQSGERAKHKDTVAFYKNLKQQGVQLSDDDQAAYQNARHKTGAYQTNKYGK